MYDLIALIILAVSLIGAAVIVFRKIPLLLELPATSSFRFDWRNVFTKIKNFPSFKRFSIDIFLQKLLSRIRILTLKTDNKTSGWLQKLREKSRKKKFEENDNYWEEIKKSTRNK